ncbi:MAG TPA: M20/M25/M40 family metallo-hydrolase [Vicinamibacterales bacterium]|nr:M20/M25/M40 family metallo-hydrolase [Vicinamibacterales bacterium]
MKMLAAAAAVAVTLSAQARPAPDFAAAREEAARTLSSLVQIDTSNPPGNEAKAAAFIKQILDKEGIPSEIFEAQPGRANLVARLKGNGRKRPILLMGHLDVVGVERDKWSFDPFGGTIKDGYVYGRGASDDKGMTTACLEVFLLLHRLKVPLDRDVIYLAEADEEAGGGSGINFMVQKHWDAIDSEFALNEGGTIYEKDGKARYVAVATTEKVPRGMTVRATGTSGHGSMPRLDNPVTHLAAAVAKIGNWQPPMRLNETTKAFFERLAKISPPEEAQVYAALEDPAKTAAAQETLRRTNIGYNSMLRTSVVPTIVKGGFRSNVIPAEAEATLDVRALPDEDIPKLIETLTKLVDDPAVTIQRTSGAAAGRPTPPPSGLQTEMFRALEGAQAKVFPGIVTVPMMLTGATDSAQLRVKGVQAYGLGSVAGDRERGAVHGNDERLSVEGLGKFVELIYAAVTDVAASR